MKTSSIFARKPISMIIVGAAIAAFVLLLVAGIFLFRTRESCPPNCNVILISVDSLRADHLDLYGYERKTTPNLTAWSQNALVFDNYFAASYLTPVSEMVVQTGLYPTVNGVIGFNTPLAASARTLAEILKNSGYRTAAIGSSPEFYDVSSGRIGGALPASFRRGFDEYFDDYYKNPAETGILPPSGETQNDWKSYSWPKYYRGLPFGALDWLKKNSRDKFFLWLPIGTAHWPYNIGRPYKFTDPSYDGWLKNKGLAWFGDAKIGDIREIYKGQRWYGGQSAPITSKDEQFIVDRYDDGIYLTDLFLGEVFRAIGEAGLEKNSIVIIESEHGEELGERGYFAHYDIFDQEVRVPLIVKIPGFSPRRVDDLISNIDIMPTVLETLGITPPQNIDGESFIPLLRTGIPARQSDENVFIERIPLWEHTIGAMARTDPRFRWLADFTRLDTEDHFRDLAIRTKDWKLIFRESRDIQDKYSWWRRLTGDTLPMPEYELYDLKNDPDETANVVNRYPDIAGKLKAALAEWKTAIDAKSSVRNTGPPLIQPYF